MTADKQSKKRQQTELERLREENELLQIENEYLKKLRALVQEEEDNKRKSSKS
ncbi:Transposase (orfA) of ISLsa2 (C-terminal fragment), authentic frameshift [Latilactobacillus sakei subsp. sakei 23K]|nr:Transposase (orfA) of ISLsa2 (C-terminal fragment), authentic frameshift [Latilactobacillus sakei subsp. sakei 23K]